jgi:5-carboxymethyl-2-hydroxymuconate isomerase
MMPLVTVTLQKGKSRQVKKQITTAIHRALVNCFKIPEGDRNQRIIEIEPENFECSQGETDNFITIEMTVFPGRSLDAKKNYTRKLMTV